MCSISTPRLQPSLIPNPSRPGCLKATSVSAGHNPAMSTFHQLWLQPGNPVPFSPILPVTDPLGLHCCLDSYPPFLFTDAPAIFAIVKEVNT